MGEKQSRISSMETVRTFIARGTCSQTLACSLNRAFGHPLKEEEQASDPLAGGIVQHGYQCGMLWGSTLAAGAEAYRRFGTGPQAEAKAILAAQRIMDSFRTQNKETDCSELTGMQESLTSRQLTTYFFLKGGVIGCFRMAARYAPLAYNEINTALSEEHIEIPASPVSCTAELARKMGTADMHAVMAAGFAGGIGLSGGACGALGAAIWITQMNTVKKGGKSEYKSKESQDLIGKFVKCTGYEFECSKIVGRKFDSIADHADHVCDGGCSKIIDALASNCPNVI